MGRHPDQPGTSGLEPEGHVVATTAATPPPDAEPTTEDRLDAADKRDALADTHDLEALGRDHAADARDLAMDRRDAAYVRDLDAHPATDDDGRATGLRDVAALRRAQDAEQRGLAAEDRRDAEQDREQASRERLHALADREELAGMLAEAAIDPLTGARTRAAGLAELELEAERCRRTNVLLVVAYVDAVGLKQTNDTEGHAAGDELLRRVVALLRAHVRVYDLVIRVGGDEFLCAMSDMTLQGARDRFSTIAGALAGPPRPAAIRMGFAELCDGESAAELVARADHEMISSHGGRG